MNEPPRYLICTDLDRTLIPNGPQPESPGARVAFTKLASHPGIVLAYVSGRHRSLVANAVASYALPLPDFVVADVGTTIYRVENRQDWQHLFDWEDQIARDWQGLTHADLKRQLADIPGLRLQESRKQNRHKLSYYVPLQADRNAISALIQQRFEQLEVKASLVWSTDEPAGVGLLDVLPASATKFHAVSALMDRLGIPEARTVFCGDSGNDIEVLVSPVPAVLVRNAQPEVRAAALALSQQHGNSENLYCAEGGFAGMNGNYAAGILEGLAHYHPDLVALMGLEESGDANDGQR